MKTVYVTTLAFAVLGAGPLWAAQNGDMGQGEKNLRLVRSLSDPEPQIRPEQSQKPSPSQMQRMAQVLIAEVQKCWAVPVAVRSVIDQPVVVVRLSLDREGIVSGEPSFLSGEGRENLRKPLFDSTVRAILKCQPYGIAKQFPQYYDSWKEIRMRFDPRAK